MIITKMYFKLFLLLWFTILLQGCETLIGPYSPTAYKYATSLKVETLSTMSKAKGSYRNHKNEIERLIIELSKAHEYVKGVPSNSISSKQWEILLRENDGKKGSEKDGKLLGKFFAKWKKDSKLSKGYIKVFKKTVSEAFDQIICLEVNKGKATSCINAGDKK